MVARGPARRDRDSGAAAVEFALVVPILLVMLFGMIDYGMYFTNQLAVKQGVQNAARQGAVASFGTEDPQCSGMSYNGTPTPEMKALACTVSLRTRPVIGASYVKILVPDAFTKGNRLVVCEMVKTSGLTGFVPLPNGGLVGSRVQMSIEQDEPGPQNGAEQTVPAGMSWSWCTADPA